MQDVYTKVLSEYYGINCNNCDKNTNLLNRSNLTDSFWLEFMVKKLNLNTKCRTNLQIQLASIA